MTGVFITFEGIEGAGKTTQARMLAEYLQSQGVTTLVAREPGGTWLGEEIRCLLLRSDRPIGGRAEMLLFLAARAQNTAQMIRPALEAGTWVICDRYADSTVAYQGYGRGLDLKTIRMLNEFCTGGLEPDITFLLDLPAEQGLARQGTRNRMEEEPLEFHRRVREGYLKEAARDPGRIRILDAQRSPEDIHREVVEVAERQLSSFSGGGRNAWLCGKPAEAEEAGGSQ